MPLGGFGSRKEWEEAYRAEHGYYPGQGPESYEEAERNRLWSQDWQTQHGTQPITEDVWKGHYYRPQDFQDYGQYEQMARETIAREREKLAYQAPKAPIGPKHLPPDKPDVIREAQETWGTQAESLWQQPSPLPQERAPLPPPAPPQAPSVTQQPQKPATYQQHLPLVGQPQVYPQPAQALPTPTAPPPLQFTVPTGTTLPSGIGMPTGIGGVPAPTIGLRGASEADWKEWLFPEQQAKPAPKVESLYLPGLPPRQPAPKPEPEQPLRGPGLAAPAPPPPADRRAMGMRGLLPEQKRGYLTDQEKAKLAQYVDPTHFSRMSPREQESIIKRWGIREGTEKQPLYTREGAEQAALGAMQTGMELGSRAMGMAIPEIAKPPLDVAWGAVRDPLLQVAARPAEWLEHPIALLGQVGLPAVASAAAGKLTGEDGVWLVPMLTDGTVNVSEPKHRDSLLYMTVGASNILYSLQADPEKARPYFNELLSANTPEERERITESYRNWVVEMAGQMPFDPLFFLPWAVRRVPGLNTVVAKTTGRIAKASDATVVKNTAKMLTESLPETARTTLQRYGMEWIEPALRLETYMLPHTRAANTASRSYALLGSIIKNAGNPKEVMDTLARYVKGEALATEGKWMYSKYFENPVKVLDRVLDEGFELQPPRKSYAPGLKGQWSDDWALEAFEQFGEPIAKKASEMYDLKAMGLAGVPGRVALGATSIPDGFRQALSTYALTTNPSYHVANACGDTLLRFIDGNYTPVGTLTKAAKFKMWGVDSKTFIGGGFSEFMEETTMYPIPGAVKAAKRATPGLRDLQGLQYTAEYNRRTTAYYQAINKSFIESKRIMLDPLLSTLDPAVAKEFRKIFGVNDMWTDAEPKLMTVVEDMATEKGLQVSRPYANVNVWEDLPPHLKDDLMLIGDPEIPLWNEEMSKAIATATDAQDAITQVERIRDNYVSKGREQLAIGDTSDLPKFSQTESKVLTVETLQEGAERLAKELGIPETELNAKLQEAMLDLGRTDEAVHKTWNAFIESADLSGNDAGAYLGELYYKYVDLEDVRRGAIDPKRKEIVAGLQSGDPALRQAAGDAWGGYFGDAAQANTEFTQGTTALLEMGLDDLKRVAAGETLLDVMPDASYVERQIQYMQRPIDIEVQQWVPEEGVPIAGQAPGLFEEKIAANRQEIRNAQNRAAAVLARSDDPVKAMEVFMDAHYDTQNMQRIAAHTQEQTRTLMLDADDPMTLAKHQQMSNAAWDTARENALQRWDGATQKIVAVEPRQTLAVPVPEEIVAVPEVREPGPATKALIDETVEEAVETRPVTPPEPGLTPERMSPRERALAEAEEIPPKAAKLGEEVVTPAGLPPVGTEIGIVDEIAMGTTGVKRYSVRGVVVRYVDDPVTGDKIPVIRTSGGKETPLARWADPNAEIITPAPIEGKILTEPPVTPAERMGEVKKPEPPRALTEEELRQKTPLEVEELPPTRAQQAELEEELFAYEPTMEEAKKAERQALQEVAREGQKEIPDDVMRKFYNYQKMEVTRTPPSSKGLGEEFDKVAQRLGFEYEEELARAIDSQARATKRGKARIAELAPDVEPSVTPARIAPEPAEAPRVVDEEMLSPREKALAAKAQKVLPEKPPAPDLDEAARSATLPPTAEIRLPAYENWIDQATEHIIGMIESDFDSLKYNTTVMDAQAVSQLREFVSTQIAPAYRDMEQIAITSGKKIADFSMNSGNQFWWDVAMMWWAPYTYWSSRQGVNMLRRMAAQPALAMDLVRFDKAMNSEYERLGLPQRARFGKVPIEMSNGDVVSVDFWNVLNPFFGNYLDMEHIGGQKETLGKAIETTQAMGMYPWIWWLEAAEEAGQYESPFGEVDWAWQVPFGNWTRMIQAGTSLIDTVAPGTFPEGGLRMGTAGKQITYDKGEGFTTRESPTGAYYVRRAATWLLLSGTITNKQEALIGLLTRQIEEGKNTYENAAQYEPFKRALDEAARTTGARDLFRGVVGIGAETVPAEERAIREEQERRRTEQLSPAEIAAAQPGAPPQDFDAPLSEEDKAYWTKYYEEHPEMSTHKYKDRMQTASGMFWDSYWALKALLPRGDPGGPIWEALEADQYYQSVIGNLQDHPEKLTAEMVEKATAHLEDYIAQLSRAAVSPEGAMLGGVAPGEQAAQVERAPEILGPATGAPGLPMPAMEGTPEEYAQYDERLKRINAQVTAKHPDYFTQRDQYFALPEGEEKRLSPERSAFRAQYPGFVDAWVMHSTLIEQDPIVAKWKLFEEGGEAYKPFPSRYTAPGTAAAPPVGTAAPTGAVVTAAGDLGRQAAEGSPPAATLSPAGYPMTTTGEGYDTRMMLGVGDIPPAPPAPEQLIDPSQLSPQEREGLAQRAAAIKQAVAAQYPDYWTWNEAYFDLPEGQARRDYRYRNPHYEAASNLYNSLILADPVLSQVWKTWLYDHWAGWGNVDVAAQRLGQGGGVFRSVNYQDGTPRRGYGAEWKPRYSSSGGRVYPPSPRERRRPYYQSPEIKQWQKSVPDLWVKGKWY